MRWFLGFSLVWLLQSVPAWGAFNPPPLTAAQISAVMSGQNLNLGAGTITINSAQVRVGNLFTQPYGNEWMQSQFWGYNAGAVYPIQTDSGFGAIGIGVGALQNQATPGNEDVAVGPLAAQMATNISLSTAIGMHAMGSQLTGAGYTALGDDAMRDAIASSGYVTAVGQGAAAHGGFGSVTAVGAQAALGNSSVVAFSGTLTAGDVVSLTLSSSVSGLSGLPLTVQHTVVGGDTLNSVATALANAIGQNVGGPSYQLGAAVTNLPDGTVALSLDFPGTATTGWAVATTPSVTGAATEVLAVYSGQNGNQIDAFGNQAISAPAGYGLFGDAAFGDEAGQYLTSGQYDALFGLTTGQNLTSGSANAVFGALGMQHATTASHNGGVGFWVFKNLTTGNQNTAEGREACSALTSGSNDVCVGFRAGATTLQTGTGNILIASGARTVDTPAADTSSYLNIENTFIENTSAPTISGGFGTSAGIAAGTSSAAFAVNVGTGGTASSGVVAFANPAPHGWACSAVDTTNYATANTIAVPTSPTTITLLNYTRAGGTATAWAPSDVIAVACNGY